MNASHARRLTRGTRWTFAVATLAAVISCGERGTGPARAAVATIATSRDTAWVEPGEVIALRAEPRDATGALVPRVTPQWSVVAGEAATVTSDGMLRAVGPGAAELRVRAGEAQATVVVLVEEPVAAIRIGVDADTMDVGATRSWRVRAVDGQGRERDAALALIVVGASVADARLVRGDSTWIAARAATPGTSWIVARLDATRADSVRIDVPAAAVAVTICECVPRALPGSVDTLQLRQLTAQGTGPAVTAAWLSRDPAVASVDAAGVLRFLSPGHATVVASGGGGTDSVLVEVLPHPPLWRNPDPLTLGVGQVQALWITTAGGTSLPVTATVGDTSIARVYGDSSVRALLVAGRRAGTTSITLGDGRPVPATATIRVTPSRVAWSGRFGFGTLTTEVALGTDAQFGIALADADGVHRDAVAGTFADITSTDTTVARVELAPTVGRGTGDPLVVVRLLPVAPGRAALVGRIGAGLVDTLPIAVTATGRVRFAERGAIAVGVGLRRTIGFTWTGTPPASGTRVALRHARPDLLDVPDSSASEWSMPWGTELAGRASGTDTIIASVPGYGEDTLVVRVAPARLRPLPASVSVRTGSAVSLPLGVVDSTGIPGTPTREVVLRTSADRPGMLRMGSRVAIRPEMFVDWTAILRPLDTGTVVVTVRDSTGTLAPVSTTIRVTLDSTLRVQSVAARPLPSGAERTVALLHLPDVWPPSVRIRSTDPTVLQVPDSIVPGPGDAGTLGIVARAGLPGSARVVAWAPGFADAVSIPMTVGPRRLTLSTPDVLVATGAPATLRVRHVGPDGRALAATAPIHVLIAAPDGGAAVAPSSVVIAAGDTASEPFTVLPGSAAGMFRIALRDAAGAAPGVVPDTAQLRVVAPELTPRNEGAATVGVGQGMMLMIERPAELAGTPLVVPVQRVGTRSEVAGSVAFAAGATTAELAVQGLRVGTDTLRLAAAPYAPLRVPVRVTEGRLQLDGLQGLRAGDSVAVRLLVTDEGGTARAVVAATTFALRLDAGLVASDGRERVTAVTVPAGADRSERFWVRATTGTFTLRVEHLDYAPLVRSVTVP